MKCKKCGKVFPKKDMNISGAKGKSKYFARYYCPICSLNPKKTIGYS
jgi:rubredoxin